MFFDWSTPTMRKVGGGEFEEISEFIVEVGEEDLPYSRKD